MSFKLGYWFWLLLFVYCFLVFLDFIILKSLLHIIFQNTSHCWSSAITAQYYNCSTTGQKIIRRSIKTISNIYVTQSSNDWKPLIWRISGRSTKCHRSQDGVVHVVTKQLDRQSCVWFTAWARDFSLPKNVQTGSGHHTASHSVGIRGPFRRRQTTEHQADHLLSCNSEVKNKVNPCLSSLYRLKYVHGMAADNFTLLTIHLAVKFVHSYIVKLCIS